MNGAGLLVAALENEGVKPIFGVPGEENLDVVEALRRSTIRLVVTRYEQAAAFMASTHGRLTGEAGVCLSTLGPGALNLTTGAAYALLGAMPMIMITGQKGILSRKQARFQVVDIVSTMTPLTKMARQIVSPASIPSLVREAFRLAQQERPGPVHLELPEDIAHEDWDPLIPPHPIEYPSPIPPRSIARPAHPQGRAALVMGRGRQSPRLSDALSAFVGRLQIRSSSPRWAGLGLRRRRKYICTAALSSATMSGAIDRADLIIASAMTRGKAPFLMGRTGPRYCMSVTPVEGCSSPCRAGRRRRAQPQVAGRSAGRPPGRRRRPAAAAEILPI